MKAYVFSIPYRIKIFQIFSLRIWRAEVRSKSFHGANSIKFPNQRETCIFYITVMLE